MDIHELAIDNLVSTRDANSIGLGPYEINCLCRQGILRRIIRGWYAVCSPGEPLPPWEGTTPWGRDLNRHLLLIGALLRSFEGRVIASHQSGLVLAGARLYGVDLALAHVSRVANTHSRHRKLATIHPRIGGDPVIAPSGLAMVSPAIAAIQVGLIEHAGRLASADPFLVAADGLLHDGIITLTQLDDAMELFTAHPGIGAIREARPYVSALHESVPETLLAQTLRVAKYDVEPQFVVPGHAARSDFRVKDEPILIEFDGLEKYRGTGEATPAAVQAALGQEKAREDALRLDGWIFVRVQWPEVRSVSAIRTKVEKARLLARAMRATRRSQPA